LFSLKKKKVDETKEL